MMFQYGGQKQQKRRSFLLWFGLPMLCLYIILTIYATYYLMGTTESYYTKKKNNRKRGENVNLRDKFGQPKVDGAVYEVEVWGKAAIGLYFWEHIMEGNLEKVNDELVSYGVKTVDNVRFTFRTGAGVVPQTVPSTSQYVILIINGRSMKKMKFAKMWLNSLDSFPNLKKVAVVLLGNEQCNNDWLLPYMVENGGLVKVAYIVYDIINQDERILQWPLGVATYRNFPIINLSKVQISATRTYVCNFLGTLYFNSSRETLRDIFNKHNLYSVCYLRLRETWQPKENKESAKEYYQALLKSDLTLCPAGINSECYRIYEAMSYGSVPVVEDVKTQGNCSAVPFQLLKYYNAPFIYVKSWSELPEILRKENLRTLQEKIRRRKKLLLWYTEFKKKLQKSFVTKIKKSFF